MKDGPEILPDKGERTLTIGQTGSGKTFFNIWSLLEEKHSPVIIYDTKDEEKFPKLPNSRIATTFTGKKNSVLSAIEDHKVDYIIFRPPVDTLADPEALDHYLTLHYTFARPGGETEGVPAYVDELYHFHKGGRPGPGLVGLLTRGRSRGITTRMSAQRPSWLSRFALTETQRFYIFNLVDGRDKETLGAVIREFGDDTPDPPQHHFHYFKIGEPHASLMKPVVLDKRYVTGYTSSLSESGGRLPWLR